MRFQLRLTSPSGSLYLAAVLASLSCVVSSQSFYSQLSRCPLSCGISGSNPLNWTYYHDTNMLQYCNEPILLDLNIHNSVDDPQTHLTLRACSAARSQLSPEVVQRRRRLGARQHLAFNTTSGSGDENSTTPLCQHAAVRTQVDVELLSWGAEASNAAGDAATAVEQLSHYLSSGESCDRTILLASSGGAIAGVYVGAQVLKSSAASLIDKFTVEVNSGLAHDRYAAQLCGNVSTQTFGLFIDTTGSLSAVQAGLSSWSQAQCIGGSDGSAVWSNMSLSVIPGSDISVTPSQHSASLIARDTCRYTQVVSGDGCWSISQRCGITQADLENYNGGSSFCNAIAIGKHVCCSAGSLPDFSPKSNPDGSCYSYTVQAGDVCSTIASTHSTTADKIEEVNKDTWGWEGCSDLQIGMKICLSTGSPPMPAQVANALCGPQVPGTTAPTNGTALADLNPCPLNACCDTWGQCGISSDFCQEDASATGAPGTAKPGSNGCISNCGTNITNNAVGPETFRRVGYFESFNINRPCLHMAPSNINTTAYNYVHYAFGSISTDFNVNVSAYPDMFSGFVNLTGTNRVLSFGGWSFSTDVDTFPIFRSGVTPAERSLFAQNVVNFLIKYDLDGLDFDWEYPGAPDLPGIPPGSPEDGTNYLDFLQQVKAVLPKGKSLSIAAPASYWYLKGFPIAEISNVVDYIIYMTYDLHGQWDFNNSFVNPGCPHGNCLRSQVNLTETNYALAMITKAGVPANKIVVGMARYGRSFQMAEAGCTGPECLFTGPNSGAWPGPCTNTSGYMSSFEINSIISQAQDPDMYNTSVTLLKDGAGSEILDGDILVYDDTQWVSYLSSNTYLARLFLFVDLNFGGTSDWALDLNEDFSPGDVGSTGDDSADDTPPCDFSTSYDTLDDLVSASGSMNIQCAEILAVQTLSNELIAALASYTDVNNGYDDLFGYYVSYIKDEVPGALAEFMNSENGPGNQYFDCTWQTFTGVNLTTRICPFPQDELGEGSYTIIFTLRNATGFYDDLASNHGIDADWVAFGTKDLSQICTPQELKNGCTQGKKVWQGFPQAASNIVVPNPKDIVTAAQANMTNLQNQIDATWMDQMFGQWDGSGLDTVQVLALPVAMLQQAVESMAQVKALGQTDKDEERKNLIITIITAVLAVVPFVGDVGVSLAGLTDVARAIALIGEVANSAVSIYDIVNDPESAPMAIFGMLLGGAGLGGSGGRSEASFSKMAALRRGMDAKDLASLGEVFTAQSTKIQKITKSCSA